MNFDIGDRLKVVAKYVIGFGLIGCVGGGIVLYFYLNDSYADDYAFIGWIIAAVGSLLSLLSGFLVYGFGELIELTQQINNKLSEVNDKDKIQKLKDFKALHDCGKISEEEYQEKMESLLG